MSVTSVRRAVVAIVMALGALAGTVALSAPAALAARVHVFERSIGASGSAAGQMQLRAAAEEVAGSGLAVNPSTHDVYVADTGNHRVDEFAADGSFVRAWGWGVGGGLGFESCTAVCSQGLSGSEPGEFSEPVFVAIDSAPGGEGDVYVADVGTNVVTKFSSEGVLQEAWGVKGQLHETPTGSGGSSAPFGALVGIAVDSAGTLDVLERPEGEEEPFHRLFQFSQAGVFTHVMGTPRGSQPYGLAVTDAGSFFKVNGDETVEEFKSGGEDVGQLRKEAHNFGEEATSGVAADAQTGDLYVNANGSVERYAFNGAGEVKEAGSATCRVEPSVGCGPTETFGSANLTAGNGGGGIAVDSSDASVYAVDASAGHVDVFELEPLGSPLVVSESVSQVTDGTATLEAEINPRSEAGEGASAYRFVYGPCPGDPSTCAGAGYPFEAGAGSLPASYQVDAVSAAVEGLKVGTSYHFEIVASNGQGPSEGPERTFTTRTGGEFKLADGREWEMVSPQEMHGALIEPLGTGGLSFGAATQAAARGGGIAYATNSPTETQPAGYAVTAQVLSTRNANGWASTDVAVSHKAATGVAANAEEVRLFSEDLSLAAVQPLSPFVPLSEDASEQTAYLRDNTTGVFTPLVTGCPEAPAVCPAAISEHADVPAGNVFGQRSLSGVPCPPETRECGPNFIGGTPDLKHVIVSSYVPLEPGANQGALYEWNANKPASEQLQLVSLVPSKTPGVEEPAAQPALGLLIGGALGLDQRGAVSSDGSHVFFTAESHLYMRDMIAKKTIQIDAPESCKGCGNGTPYPEFQFASPDRNRVLFVDTQKLTSDGKAYPKVRKLEGSQGGDLYVCELHEDSCTLKDLAPEGAVQGEVSPSEDGSWVYFAANRALASGAVSGGCTNGQPGEEFPKKFPEAATCDIYVEHFEGGVWGPVRVVAQVFDGDMSDWSLYLESMVSRVSSDGGWFTFMSQRSLTGYDNRDTVSGKRDQEVYLYEAARERLTCVSCDPSGARPHGVEYGTGENVPLLGNATWPSETWLAGSVPGWERYRENRALYPPRNLSNGGRVLFDAHGGLVPKDVNGMGDVYEFEPEGETVPGSGHKCSSASENGAVVFRPAQTFEVDGRSSEEQAGCVALMSSGSSSEESALLDASETGSDVFFLSTSVLSPLDVEGGLTLYDAHECTSASPCVPPRAVASPPCATEASCRTAPSPQPSVFGLPASAMFSGPGNVAPAPPAKGSSAAQLRAQKLAKALKACHKLRRRAKRQACERSARRRYGAKPSARGRRASNDRGAGR